MPRTAVAFSMSRCVTQNQSRARQQGRHARGRWRGGWEYLQPRKCNKNVRLAGTSCKSCHGAKYFVAPTKVESAVGEGAATAAAAATGGSSQMSIILARHAVADRNHPKGKVAQARPGLAAVWGTVVVQFGASVARTCKHVAHERSCR